MGTEGEIREELAAERKELTEAVDSLREELGNTADRGKKVGAAFGAAAGVALALRTVFRLRRRARD